MVSIFKLLLLLLFFNYSRIFFQFSELLKNLKSQGTKYHTSNAKADGQNPRKRRVTPPGIILK